MTDRSNHVVKTTAKSLEIVEIVKSFDGATHTEIRNVTGMAESTLYKHINVLLESGYLIKRSGQYELGFELFHLGEYVKKTVQPFQLINQKTEELREEIPEQVEFGVESNGLLVGYLPSTDYNPDLFHDLTEDCEPEAIDYVGSKATLHTNAIGKALLAEMSDDKIRTIAERHGLERQAKNTITSIDNLLEEIETIRENGYATTDEEWDKGLREVGIVVKPESDVIGGFNVFGPSYQINDSRLHDELPLILDNAVTDLEEQISDKNEK